jgi:hypothetical protein
MVHVGRSGVRRRRRVGRIRDAGLVRIKGMDSEGGVKVAGEKAWY